MPRTGSEIARSMVSPGKLISRAFLMKVRNRVLPSGLPPTL
jgi:hypothetical protein